MYFKKFGVRNEFSETFCKYINPGFKPQILNTFSEEQTQ